MEYIENCNVQKLVWNLGQFQTRVQELNETWLLFVTLQCCFKFNFAGAINVLMLLGPCIRYNKILGSCTEVFSYNSDSRIFSLFVCYTVLISTWLYCINIDVSDEVGVLVDISTFQWNSLLICIISNNPTITSEDFDAFHGFMLIKI